MEEKMNFTLNFSLKHRAFINIAIALWNRRDNKDLVARFHVDDGLEPDEMMRRWRVVEDKVIEKVPKLPLPEKLRKEILYFVRAVGLEMLKWKDYHGRKFGIGLSTKLCWTSQGTVDLKKTAEILVKDESIDITTRYKLACLYCLEDDVKELWNSVPQREKDYFYNDGIPRHLRSEFSLVEFWTYYVKGEMTKYSERLESIDSNEVSPYHLAFVKVALRVGNKAATEYFLHRLTPSERDNLLVKSAKDITRRFLIVRGGIGVTTYYTDTLCFLLSQMNEVQQTEVLARKPIHVLSYFLCWPWQSLFMEVANRVRDFLFEVDYKVLLRLIVDNIIKGYKDYNYHKLFGEFWRQIPDRYRKTFVKVSYIFLSQVISVGDQENVRSVFRSVTVKEREEILHHNVEDICKILIYGNKWDLLKFFIEECVTSEDSLIKFKEEVRRLSDRSVDKDSWAKFFQFLDDLIHKENEKKSMGEGISRPVKRLKFN